MADPNDRLRSFPLNVVLAELGFEDWKWRNNGTEGYGRRRKALTTPNIYPRRRSAL